MQKDDEAQTPANVSERIVKTEASAEAGQVANPYESRSYFDLNEMAGRRGFRISELPYVETQEARRKLIDWLVEYDRRLLVPSAAQSRNGS